MDLENQSRTRACITKCMGMVMSMAHNISILSGEVTLLHTCSYGVITCACSELW